MTFEFIPDESNYMDYLFYVTTKSKRVQKKRMINKFFILVVYLIMGLYLYSRQEPITSAVFFLLCLPMYFIYNHFERKQYVKHFSRYIKANFSDEIGVTTTIHLDEEGITLELGDSKTKMLWPEIQDINETGSLILIQEKNQNAIVVPKQKTDRLEELISELKRIATLHELPYHEELNWKWK